MVERVQRLLQRRHAVPLVDLVEVDVVDAEPAQARLARRDQVEAGETRVVRPVAHRHAGLGRQHHALPPALQRLAEDLLGQAARVDVGGVDQVDPGVDAPIDLPPGLLDAGGADRGEPVAAAERHRAQPEHRHPEAGRSQLPILHRRIVTGRARLRRRERRSTAASRGAECRRAPVAARQRPLSTRRGAPSDVDGDSHRQRPTTGGVAEPPDVAVTSGPTPRCWLLTFAGATRTSVGTDAGRGSLGTRHARRGAEPRAPPSIGSAARHRCRGAP